MATKTISIEIDVYERLKSLKSYPSESFSQILRRELGSPAGITAGELLRRSKQPGGLLKLSEKELQKIEKARLDHVAWKDPWTR